MCNWKASERQLGAMAMDMGTPVPGPIGCSLPIIDPSGITTLQGRALSKGCVSI